MHSTVIVRSMLIVAAVLVVILCAVQAAAAPVGTLILSSTSLDFGSQPVGTLSASQTITMTAQDAMVTITGAQILGDWAFSGWLDSTIAAGGRGTLSLKFAPTRAGLFEASLILMSTAANSPHTVRLIGYGGSPGLSVSPTSLDFGGQTLTLSSVPQTLTVSANGGSIAIHAITNSNSDEFPFTSTCPALLQPGSSCAVDVAFKPLSLGTRDGSLTIASSGAGSPQTISLTGSGVGAGVKGDLGFSATALSFGTLVVGNAGVAQKITVSAKNAPVLISAVTSDSPDYQTTTNCTAGAIAAGGTCLISVWFTPTAATPRNGTIAVMSDASGSPHVISASGLGASGTPGSVVPQTGWWWDDGVTKPGLTGIGFFIEERQHADGSYGMFFAAFLYDESGKATWLVSTGPPRGSTYTGELLKCRNGQPLLGAYRTNECRSTGEAVSMLFSDATHGAMTRPNGSTIPIDRFSFGPSATPLPPQAGAVQQNGWWWADPKSSGTGSFYGSGTGYGIEFQGSQAFVVVYSYDSAGNPTWYLTTGSLLSPTVHSGVWTPYSGGPTFNHPEGYYTGALAGPDASTVALTFTDATHGLVRMGTTGISIPIVRFTAF